ncbi:MAG: DUF4400 domain-containing protein [Chromatiales bacterium]|nr:DUF4400 domain-containing protein [Chromatiales bacterium]
MNKSNPGHGGLSALPWPRWIVLPIFAVIAALAVHQTYAWWTLADHGPAALEKTLKEEALLVSSLLRGGERVRTAQTVMEATYTALFVAPGLQALMDRKPPPTENLRTVVETPAQAVKPVLQSIAASVQLIGLRLGMVAATLPIFLFAGVAAAVDGVLIRHRRRLAVEPSRGFVYHRAKAVHRFLAGALLFLYLAPWFPTDPRWILPPFALGLSATLWIGVAYFKKYL